jgi:hypothetical protein
MTLRQILHLAILLLVGVASLANTRENRYREFFVESATDLVPEYRLPTDSDMESYWSAKDAFPYKSTDGVGAYKAPYWTCGYFNDDDVLDYAYILIHKESEDKYLFVFVSLHDAFKAILLEGAHQLEMGLATQESGRVTTASGKGYWEPSPEDPAEVEIHRQAIAFFMFESASSLFIWNTEEQTFRRHWISD